MVPHEAPHKAVYSVTTKHHVARFSGTITQLDLDATHQLLHFFGRTPCSDLGLIREAIIQDLEELSPLKKENVLAMTADFLVSISACAIHIHGAESEGNDGEK